ncbi:Cof-type HAD-IIB family hydrolase [Limosilactobacillus fermentum]|uniref:Cof-type HAD-IIB family hydrolase n=1 Tax=Limosilactobacillus fermentum TaxID=1613 RepID=UPI0027B905E7|nr:Cof-type HAD-IIB family hydrolase [Limosilactobacillus fermentum]WLW43848.1 Cof-type HAD-IIB family hydrolase [Limosilactobacillus fermentum]
MDQHLIALDMDGTTLNNQSKLTDHTVSTLRRLANDGHLVVIVTGRPWLISAHLYDQIGLKSPIINFNGALAHLPYQNWKHEYAIKVTRELTLDMLESRRELGVQTLIAEDKHHVWANHPSNELPEFLPAQLSDDQILNERNLTDDPIALTIQFDPAKKDAIINRVNERYGDFVEPRVWGGGYSIMELIHRGTHKETALSYLAHHFQIDRQHIVAFGDEQNDLEMIDFAGHGVAMKNAIPELKAVAKDVTTLDNDHDGVADYLEKYFQL